MREIVKGPMQAVQARDLARGEREFEALLAATTARQGVHSLEVGDALMSFGVEVFAAGYREQAVDYVKRAVDAYRTARGPDDVEVAVALHSYADLMTELHPDSLNASAIAAAQEALRIRRLKLGPGDIETAGAYVTLGRLRGAPVNTAGDQARIAEAATLIRSGIAIYARSANAAPDEVPGAYLLLAELYARNGQAADTLAVLPADLDESRRAGGKWVRLAPTEVRKLAGMLESHGDLKGASALIERAARR